MRGLTCINAKWILLQKMPMRNQDTLSAPTENFPGHVPMERIFLWWHFLHSGIRFFWFCCCELVRTVRESALGLSAVLSERREKVGAMGAYLCTHTHTRLKHYTVHWAVRQNLWVHRTDTKCCVFVLYPSLICVYVCLDRGVYAAALQASI